MGYLIVLRRHATLIAVVAILTGLAAGFGSLLQQNRYTSAAYIELTNASSPFRSSGGSKADLTRAMQTQIDTVRSDSVKTAVADQLGTPAPHVKVSMRAQSDELAIRATSHNRREAARVANAYATAYVAQLAKDNANADRSAQAARQQTESQLQKQLQEVQTSLATATGASAQQLQLRRDLLGAQLRAVAVQDVTQASGDDLSASILSAAAPPTAPSEPRPVRNGLLGLVAGLILGFLAAALLEVVRDKVRDKRDIKMINPDWPVVGTVPLSIRAGNAQTRDRAETYAFRGLRAKLPAVLPDGYPAKILVAGPLGGEGTSTVVAGLARSLAAAGRKVAVIDANTAAPRQHELLGSPRTPTLAQILRGPGGPDRLRHLAVGSFGSLTVVPGSHTGDVDMLASPEFATLLQQLASNNDAVLIDAGPVLSSAETLNIAQLVDITLLVAAEDTTNRRNLQVAAQRIVEAGGVCVGVVLTDLRTVVVSAPAPVEPSADSLRRTGRVDPLAPAR